MQAYTSIQSFGFRDSDKGTRAKTTHQKHHNKKESKKGLAVLDHLR